MMELAGEPRRVMEECKILEQQVETVLGKCSKKHVETVLNTSS